MTYGIKILSALLCILAVTGCRGYDWDEPNPDYRIKLVRGANGETVAVPPECPSWHSSFTGPLENNPWPQYGCSTARNLAAQVDNPDDLAEGRDWGPANGATTASSMNRYIEGKVKALYDPKEEAPAAASPMGLQ